jgi:hypothetical protein
VRRETSARGIIARASLTDKPPNGLDPCLESLHDEPEFAAIVAEIEADMAEQLARVREMERSGELEPIPEISTMAH